MNIKKGVNRVALVLAVIAIFPGFIFAWLIYDSENTKTVLVYDVTEANRKLFSDIDKTLEEFPKIKPWEKPWGKPANDPLWILPEVYREKLSKKYSPDEINAWLVNKKQNGPFYASPRIEYVSPPKWKCAIVGIIGASISFLFVLFCLRGIFWTFIWVVEGFKSGK